MIRCLGKIIYVGGFKPLNKAMRWQHVILHVEEKGLKISEGCKHDWESRGIRGTAPSTGLRACSFPCCSEQWMRDNRGRAPSSDTSLQPVPLWLDLSRSTPALWLASGLVPQKLNTKEMDRIFIPPLKPSDSQHHGANPILLKSKNLSLLGC